MNIVEIISGTPLWVWAILVYLIWRGISALSDRTLDVRKLFVFPTVFLLFSLPGLIKKYGLLSQAVGLWFGAWIVTGFVAFALFKSTKVQANQSKKLIRLPGTYSTLILVILIFVVKYYFGFQAATNPEWAATASFIAMKSIVAGIVSGISLGRAGAYFYNYFKAPESNL